MTTGKTGLPENTLGGWDAGAGRVRRRDNSDITIRLLEEENKSFDKANHSRIQLGKEKEYYDVWILINKW